MRYEAHKGLEHEMLDDTTLYYHVSWNPDFRQQAASERATGEQASDEQTIGEQTIGTTSNR